MPTRSSTPSQPRSGGATGWTPNLVASCSAITQNSGWRNARTSGLAPRSTTAGSSPTDSSRPSGSGNSPRSPRSWSVAWYAELAAQTPGVARSAYRLLKAIFNTAILDDLILKNPCRVKGGGTDRLTERRIPDVNQVAVLTQAMPEQYRAAVIVAAWGTLRRGEVLGLERRDVDLVAGTVRVERTLHEFHDGSLDLGPTKNGDPRKVYLPSSVLPALEDHLRRFVGPESDAPLFTGATGERLAPEQLLGHLGDRTPAGRAHLGALPRSAALRRHHVRHNRCEHEGDHEPWRVEVGRDGGPLRARLRGARRVACPSAQSLHEGGNVVPIVHGRRRRSRTWRARRGSR